MNPRSNYYLGLDLGRQEDHTALVLVERATVEEGWDQLYFRPKTRVEFVVRDLKRLALGTTYTQVVERVRRTLARPEMPANVELVVDATGLGAPVVEMLKNAGLRVPVTAVTITGGETAKGYHAPKRDLLAAIETLLEAGKLKIAARHPAAADLRKELETMGRDGKGKRDDLVLALALALWWARRRFPSEDTRVEMSGTRRLV